MSSESDLLQLLNCKFDMFTAQVLQKMDDLLELKDVVQQLTESKRLQRDKDADRKRKQRERDAEEETRGRLSLPKIIFMKDKLWKVLNIILIYKVVLEGMIFMIG